MIKEIGSLLNYWNDLIRQNQSYKQEHRSIYLQISEIESNRLIVKLVFSIESNQEELGFQNLIKKLNIYTKFFHYQRNYKICEYFLCFEVKKSKYEDLQDFMKFWISLNLNRQVQLIYISKQVISQICSQKNLFEIQKNSFIQEIISCKKFLNLKQETLNKLQNLDIDIVHNSNFYLSQLNLKEQSQEIMREFEVDPQKHYSEILYFEKLEIEVFLSAIQLKPMKFLSVVFQNQNILFDDNDVHQNIQKIIGSINYKQFGINVDQIICINGYLGQRNIQSTLKRKPITSLLLMFNVKYNQNQNVSQILLRNQKSVQEQLNQLFSKFQKRANFDKIANKHQFNIKQGLELFIPMISSDLFELLQESNQQHFKQDEIQSIFNQANQSEFKRIMQNELIRNNII